MAEQSNVGSSARIISLIDAWKLPFSHVIPDDKIVIMTDDAMDPLVWQSAMAALRAKGVTPVLTLFPRLKYHCADPPPAALAATVESDVVVALTTTALNSGTPGLRSLRRGGPGGRRTPIWLMEQTTVDILTGEAGAGMTDDDVEEICERQRRVGEIFDKSAALHVESKAGTKLTADISGMPPGYFAQRWSKRPFTRDSITGRLGGGTWPIGEIHAEPLPGTAEGRVVWDVTAHHPSGAWKTPVTLVIQAGRVVGIEGSDEAREVRRYIDSFGDDRSLDVGGEIALGTNHRCLPSASSMRSEKKRLGAMHFGIGHGSDRGIVNSKLRLEGIVNHPTVVADGKVICEDGEFAI